MNNKTLLLVLAAALASGNALAAKPGASTSNPAHAQTIHAASTHQFTLNVPVRLVVIGSVWTLGQVKCFCRTASATGGNGGSSPKFST